MSVFVSGATGYIAQHVVKELIAKGYKVVGSVRSKEKGERLALNVGDNFVYEVVPDIGAKGAFNDALKAHPEVRTVLHTASPFHFKTTDPERDLLVPAVEGTKNALSAIQQYAPQVTKVVITSSYAAIAPASVAADPNFVVTEATWNDITWEDAVKDAYQGYRGSKTFAERAAWDFVEQHKPRFALATVNPVFVFGPQAFDSEVKDELNTSAEFINALLKLQPDSEVPFFKGTFVDVRDVARAHLVAFEKDDAAGKRLLLANGKFVAQTVLDILHEHFKQLNGKIPRGTPGAGQDVLDTMPQVNNEATRKLLGFELTSLEQSVVDTVQQVLDVNGNVKS
ncbi:NAD-dependent epimerase/dehydratase domain-containing protein [[Candida] zeylanoides]